MGRAIRLLLLLAGLGAAGLALAGTTYRMPIITFTPGEKPKLDNICVGESAAEGQSKLNVNGDRMVVRRVVGKSRMCRTKEAPVLAEVDLIPSQRFRSTLSVELPPQFVPEAITTHDRFNGVRLRAKDPKTSIQFTVSSYTREAIPDPKRYVLEQRERQMKWANPKQTDIEETTIHGAKASRWETAITVKALVSRSYTHLTTVIVGDRELVFTDVFGDSRHVPADHQPLWALSESLRGVSDAEPAAEGVAPPEATEPETPPSDTGAA